jgi:hypothetical protein
VFYHDALEAHKDNKDVLMPDCSFRLLLFSHIQFSSQHPQAAIEYRAYQSGYRYNLPDGRTYQSPFWSRGKHSLYIIGVKVGLMNYFSGVFWCLGFVSIGRIWRKKICDFFDFFVSQKRLSDIAYLKLEPQIAQMTQIFIRQDKQGLLDEILP